MSKLLIDTDNKSVAFLNDSGGASIVAADGTRAETKPDGTMGIVNLGNNPATGKPLESVPGYVSETATAVRNLQSTDAGKPNPTQSHSEKEVRQKFAVMNGMHIDLELTKARAVYELIRPSDGSRAEVAVHVKVPAGAAGRVRIELAGTKSGDVTGGAQLGVGARDAAPIQATTMEGQLASYRQEVPVKAGEFVTAFLRLDGGDQSIYFVVTPV